MSEVIIYYQIISTCRGTPENSQNCSLLTTEHYMLIIDYKTYNFPKRVAWKHSVEIFSFTKVVRNIEHMRMRFICMRHDNHQ